MAAMTRVEVETLATVLAHDGPIRAEELGAMMARARDPVGHSVAYETGRRRVRPLLDAGALRRLGPGTYALTEKGRIAAALVLAREPALRAVFLDED